MDSIELKRRTKRFALRVIEYVEGHPKSVTADVIKRQLVKSSTAVGANYRAACRARSKAEFISKMSIVEEEADECCYWLELLADSGLSDQAAVAELWKEADELTAIVVASCKTARQSSQ